MKYWQILTLALLVANATQLSSMSLEDRLDETTKKSVKKAAAAALKVAVAAKKAEAAESIKNDMKEVAKTQKKEDSDSINESLDKVGAEEEKKAVERAVAHVEKVRSQKLIVHNNALKEIESIKKDAQKKHDEINKDTKDAMDKAIAKGQKGILGLDSKK